MEDGGEERGKEERGREGGKEGRRTGKDGACAVLALRHAAEVALAVLLLRAHAGGVVGAGAAGEAVPEAVVLDVRISLSCQPIHTRPT